MLKHWLPKPLLAAGTWRKLRVWASTREHLFKTEAKLCLGRELTPKCIWQLWGIPPPATCYWEKSLWNLFSKNAKVFSHFVLDGTKQTKRLLPNLVCQTRILAPRPGGCITQGHRDCPHSPRTERLPLPDSTEALLTEDADIGGPADSEPPWVKNGSMIFTIDS